MPALRKLNDAEMQELRQEKEKAYKKDGSAYKNMSESMVMHADNLDATKFIASWFIKDAFNYGWEKKVSENQQISHNEKDPRKKMFGIALGIGTFIGALIGVGIAVLFPMAIPVAIGIAVGATLIGAAFGALDGYIENRALTGAVKIGEGKAQEGIEKIIERSDNQSKMSALEAKVEQLSRVQQQVVTNEHSVGQVKQNAVGVTRG